MHLVEDTKQIRYAHQAEQCTLRSNWNPKCHTTDNCPAGIDLWKKLVRGVHCQLGLFHYTYRITKTLNKECNGWKDAVASLQTCMYYYDTSDLENVTRCLETGLLGKVNGENCPEEKIPSKAKTYRENIRIWTYDAAAIQDRLRKWLRTHAEVSDETNGQYLFSRDTDKTVIEQIKKARWVVDSLSKDELYLEVKANLKSPTGLSTFIGARGTESKLEKGHHAIAHFANTGMRPSLADFLGLGGIALYNLRIRFRLKLAKMSPTERAKVPSAFQRAPHFTNHLRLSHNNMLGSKVGLPVVHDQVEVLQPDNGELFFFEYYDAQKQREKDGIQHDDTNNRCLCKDCGMYNNHYRKRKPQWMTQDDVSRTNPIITIEEESPPPPPPPPPAVPLQLAPRTIEAPPPTQPATAAVPLQDATIALQIHMLQQQLLLQQLIQQQQQVPNASRFAYSSMVKDTKKRVNKK